MVRWVRQEDDKGCAIASTAMLTGQTYRQVRRAFANCFDDEGVADHAVEEYLVRRGFALQRLRPYSLLRGRHCKLKPFADLHFCVVASATNEVPHMVVMLADGTVLDPLTPTRKRLSDYDIVIYIAAVIQVSTPRKF
jgi:hypothetical protein